MSRYSLRHACLLEISGELSPEKRRKLLQIITADPGANREYQKIRRNFLHLAHLPIPEPSAEERRSIPFLIKRSLRLRLAALPLKGRASRRPLLFACASAVLCVGLLITFVQLSSAQESAAWHREQEQTARTNALIDRILSPARPTAYDQALSDAQASIRQLQTQSPTLARLQSQPMSELFATLAAAPSDLDNTVLYNSPGAPTPAPPAP